MRLGLLAAVVAAAVGCGPRRIRIYPVASCDYRMLIGYKCQAQGDKSADCVLVPQYAQPVNIAGPGDPSKGEIVRCYPDYSADGHQLLP